MKKVLSVVLAMLLSSSMLIACQNSSGGDQDPKDSDSKPNTSTDDESSKPAGEERELYSITLLGNVATEMKEFDVAYIEGLEEALNLEIDLELPPATSYNERIQMMLVGGEYVDATLIPNHNSKMYIDAVKDGVFIPLNEYLDESPNLLEYTYDISWDTLKTLGDDEIYGIPRTSIARADGFLIRQDWLDNLGVTGLEEGVNLTLEKFEDIILKFTNDDPDGNGVADTYGLAGHSDDLGNMNVQLGPVFGLTGWKEYNGEYMNPMYSKEMTNYKDALTWTNKMWELGVIDPDWPTVQRDIAVDRFKKGITGVLDEFAGWLTDTENAGKQLNEDYELAYITGIVKEQGGVYTSANSSTGLWGHWSIANSTEKPERVVEMFDYMLSDNYWHNTKYGYEGISYTKNGDEFVATDIYDGTGVGRQSMRRHNDGSFFVSLNQSAEDRIRIENLIDICIEQYEFPLDRGFRPTVADDPVFIDYEKDMKVQISKIIVGELAVDEWDNILDGWYEAGGDKYVSEMQEYIASIQK